jgi:hypothetical protein
VIANGDVTTVAEIEQIKAETGCDGVMIGRAAIGNPWIFSRLDRDQAGTEPPRTLEPGASRGPQRRGISSMPRPGRLKSLDPQRRLGPAHRHEVARIAEETGLHVNPLDGWLRKRRGMA